MIVNRRSIRLKGYDYSQAGAYFVTICTQNRECLFGDVVNGEMVLNEFGELVFATWADLPNHNFGIELDAFIAMPNHVHGIINIVRAGLEPARTGKMQNLSEIIRQFKTFSARRINQLRNTPGLPLWQRNYYEHVVRDEDDLYRIRKYIINNPAKWR